MSYIETLRQEISDSVPTFDAAGIVTTAGLVYPLGLDTKVLSTIFEMIVRPQVVAVAEELDLKVHEPEQQNYYPDFTIMKDEADTHKIALDVKTAYRRPTAGGWTTSFTLGGYTSFLRNPTKNIAFPNNQYGSHWILGFIYSRVPVDAHEVLGVGEPEKLVSPLTDVEWFLVEKYKIAATRAGSGNTTNIGSISGTSLDDFRDGTGPFADLGEGVFEEYWANYGKDTFTSLPGYNTWKAEQ
ncbi:MAG: type II restriction endonuclease [Acidimicrobiales bacterium]